MAKSYRLKEIIDWEIKKSTGKSNARLKKGEVKAKPFKHSSATRFFDELKLWKTALQIETLSADDSN